MTAIEIARRLAELGDTEKACQAYALAFDQAQEPAGELEAAVYILQNGGDYKISYSAFVSLYGRGLFQEDCLAILTQAFYEPNVKLLKSRYQNNCKLLEKYPYLFRRDFIDFESLPIRFYPFDDNCFVPFYVQEGRFGELIDLKEPVVTRNFFKDLTDPILARDVFSQYELEYLVDNVRKSEYVARENHIYLHYPDWGVFCSYLQCLSLKQILGEKKVVFLIGDEVEQYPIDFNERFGLDYAAFPVKPLGIREIKRMVWHTQLSYHNGGDFFNEIFDAHPNLLTMPSMMFDFVEETIAVCRTALERSKNVKEAMQRFPDWAPWLTEELYHLRDRTDKDILVTTYLSDERIDKFVDPAARIVPALFFQPHFASIQYELNIDDVDRTILMSKEYEKMRTSPLFRGFKYIKTFTPMRRITTSYGATVKFMYARTKDTVREDGKKAIVGDAISNRILNRSFMIDPQDRLYRDSVLVRFEDGKLNPKATFTALAAFLDLPYTESMTYCSLFGERDPESLAGNDLGFSPAAIYRTYDDYANDAERYFIEYFTRDAYEYYGYDFKYYDGRPVDETRAEELIENFSTIDRYIHDTWEENFYADAEVLLDGERADSDIESSTRQQLLEKQMEMYKANRLRNARFLLRGLRFVNKKGQPLRMMRRLELDPELLEQPLYH